MVDCGAGGSFFLYLDRHSGRIELRSGTVRVPLPAALVPETTAMYFEEPTDSDGFTVRKVGSAVVRGAGRSREFWTGERWMTASLGLAAAAAALP